MQSDAFIRGLLGPFGSGKSSGCVWDIATRGVKQAPGPDGVRRSRWVVIRNTYAQLMDTTVKTFLQWFPPHVHGNWTPSRHEYVIRSLKAAADEPGAEIEVLFRALDRPDQVSNLLSLEVTGGWVNEAREVPWPIIEALQGRVGRYPAKKDGGATWSGIIMDTNPPDTDSEWYRFFEEGDYTEDVAALAEVIPGITVENFARIFKQPSGRASNAENRSNLPPGYYERMLIGKTKEWVKVYVDGDYGFDVDGKAVYDDDYDDDFHCPKAPGPGEKDKRPLALREVTIYRGWDFGLTPACVFAQMTPGGQLLVLDEINARSMGIARFSDDVIQFSNQMYPGFDFIDIGDPAGMQRAQTDERTCFELLHAKGIHIEAGLQDPTIRWESVRKPLQSLVSKGKPQFILHPRCKVLRRGFMGGYQLRRLKVAGERYAETAEKNVYSHCFPAGTMIATPGGDVAIEDIRSGAEVLTPVGPRRVVGSMWSRSSDLLKISLSTGRQIICTGNHEIATPGGFIRADALQYADKVVVKQDQWAGRSSTHIKSSTGFGTIESRRAITSPMMASTCTATYGQPLMGQSRRGITSTISTAIAQTMISATSWLWRLAIMSGCIKSSIAESFRNGLLSTWAQFVLLPASGIGPLLAASGTLSTGGALLPRRRSRSGHAFNAASLTKPSAGRERSDTAARIVSRQQDCGAEWITRIAGVPSALGRSVSTDILAHEPAAVIVGVSRVETPSPVRVYDLTVEDAHCFYAGGVLVSNCHDALQYLCTRIFATGLRTSKAKPTDENERDYRALMDATRNQVTGY